MRLLLIGCTGFIGRELVPHLLEAGHHLTLISRQKPQRVFHKLQADRLTFLQCDPANPKNWQQGILSKALETTEGVINFAGEPIANKRWTAKHCLELQSSRLKTTKGLIEAMHQLRKPIPILINASAVGYYGTSSNRPFTEESEFGPDFLSTLCQEWEATAAEKPKSTRLLILRIGIVLGPDGGALGKMLPVCKAGLGGPIGDGRQWMSWIHRTDLCQMIQLALTNESWKGIVNAVSPNPVAMKTFAAELGKNLGRPSLLAVPGPIVKLLLGDGARIVLEGQQVKSIRLQKLGFKFRYPKLEQALSSFTNPKPVNKL